MPRNSMYMGIVTLTAEGSTVIEQETEVETGGTSESVTPTSNGKVPANVGIPETTPVTGSITRPGGREPDEIVKA